MLVTRCCDNSSMSRAASASRNICETSAVTGTGRSIGNAEVICTDSRMPRCVKYSCNRNAPSNGAGGHVVIGAHGHDEEVRVVGAGVRADATGGGIDAGHRLLPKL